jgi:phosphatidylglycerophosphate synthase
VLCGILIIIIITGAFNKQPKQEFMSCDEFIKDWLQDHGQAHKVEEQFEKMKKDPAGKLYMPLIYKGAKIFLKLGLNPNKVSYINLILSFFVFYGVIMAGKGSSLDSFSQQPLYGLWFLPLGLLVLFTGIVDGIDGAIARLLHIKSKSGAWLDNVIDRVSDTLMLVGLVSSSLSVGLNIGLNFEWLVWTNIILIFIYEYMRARHEGLGLHETKPFVGERVTRILVILTFFVIYGISSLGVLLTNLINPASTIWSTSHPWVLNWIMFIFQVCMLCIMVLSVTLLARYTWKELKKLDKIDGVK